MGKKTDEAIMWKLARNFREDHLESTAAEQLAYAQDPKNISNILSNREQVEAIEREYSIFGPNENPVAGMAHGITGLIGSLFRSGRGGNKGR